MEIVHIASELTPLAKVGGLADVIQGLGKELVRKGCQVTIVLPKYDCLHAEHLKNLRVEKDDLISFDGPDMIRNTIWSAQVDGLNVLLIESHSKKNFFNRGMIYGCYDDTDRFCYFARTAMEALFKMGKSPDIIHVHDWPTAIVPLLYKHMYRALGFQVGGCVLTLHNMQHQGQCFPETLSRVGLKGEYYLAADQMQDPDIAYDVNLLKGGIVYTDRITTVSPTYEKEILTPEGAFGLHDTLNQHRHKLRGILNGIDEEFWNPEKDPYLTSRYKAAGPGKRKNKSELQRSLGLQESNQPLVAVIARLVPQKSPDLIKRALFRTLELGGQFVLLGSSPIPDIHSEFEKLQSDLKNHPSAAVLMDKNEEVAHQIYAGSDLFFLPSRFEPCGLTQLIALRYGSIPIARLTGGLSDTVFDVDTSPLPLKKRNGFTFVNIDVKEVDEVLLRAIKCYQTDQKKWESLVINAMTTDHSWKKPAEQYLQLYQEIASENKPLKTSIVA
jgi:starch synthase